jgi:glycosyltransferase involved in cell wall biosynthesis
MSIGETLCSMASGADPVTVVIPYSEAATPPEMLEEAVASVESQTVPTETAVMRDERERGPGWARNRGLDRADTRYVAFLDADDRWKSAKLQRQLERLDETDASVCLEGPRDRSRETFVRQLFLGNVQSVTSSVLVDTEAVGPRFDETLTRREDHLFVLETISEAGVCFCPDLTTVRKHDRGLSAATPPWLRIREDVRFARRVRRRVPEVAALLSAYYRVPRESDEGIENTLGDAYRAACLGVGIRATVNLLRSATAQRS